MEFELPIRPNLEEAITATKSKFHSDLSIFTIYSMVKFSYILGWIPEIAGRLFLDIFYSGVNIKVITSNYSAI